MKMVLRSPLRTQLSCLAPALSGRRRDHHRRVLAWQLAHRDGLDEPIDALSAEIRRGLRNLAVEALPPPPGRLEGEDSGGG